MYLCNRGGSAITKNKTMILKKYVQGGFSNIKTFDRFARLKKRRTDGRQCRTNKQDFKENVVKKIKNKKDPCHYVHCQ